MKRRDKAVTDHKSGVVRDGFFFSSDESLDIIRWKLTRCYILTFWLQIFYLFIFNSSCISFQCVLQSLRFNNVSSTCASSNNDFIHFRPGKILFDNFLSNPFFPTLHFDIIVKSTNTVSSGSCYWQFKRNTFQGL